MFASAAVISGGTASAADGSVASAPAAAVMGHPLLGLGVIPCCALAVAIALRGLPPTKGDASAMKSMEILAVIYPNTSSNFAGK